MRIIAPNCKILKTSLDSIIMQRKRLHVLLFQNPSSHLNKQLVYSSSGLGLQLALKLNVSGTRYQNQLANCLTNLLRRSFIQSLTMNTLYEKYKLIKIQEAAMHPVTRGFWSGVAHLVFVPHPNCLYGAGYGCKSCFKLED